MFSSSLRVCLVFISVVTATDGFEIYDLARCDFNSTELKDIEYTYSLFFNKDEILRFSSSLNKFIGFTELGEKLVERFNKDPSRMTMFRAQKGTYCKQNIDEWQKNILTKSVQPTVRLHFTTPPSGGHPSMLVCSVYDFYPKLIKVTWRRDGHEVTSDVTSTDELADGDWFYQVHSHLEYTPRAGEKISCVVEHMSLKEPMITDWDPPMSKSLKTKITWGVIGGAYLILILLTGFICYKREVQGHTLVPPADSSPGLGPGPSPVYGVLSCCCFNLPVFSSSALTPAGATEQLTSDPGPGSE